MGAGSEIVGNVASAVTYLLPGFVAYVLFYRTMVPGRRESDLVIAAKSLIWSLSIDICFLWGAGPEGVDWLSPWVIAGTLAVAVVTGLVAGGIVRWGVLDWLWRQLGLRHSWRVDEWSDFFDVSEDPCFLYVHLSDGRSYLGWPERYSDDPSAAQKELVLTKTWLFGTRENSEPAIWLGQRVYIPSGAIISVERGPSVEEVEAAARANFSG